MNKFSARNRVRKPKKSEKTETRNRLSDETKVSATTKKVPDKNGSGKTNTPLDEAKLRALFLLLLQGRTQAECARHFSVTDRTIRNWINRLDDLRPEILRALHPEKEMVRALYRFVARETELLKLKNEAEKDNDARTIISCNKELRRLESERQRFLEKVGLFANFRPQFNVDKDIAAEDAGYITGITAELLQFSGLESDQYDLDEEP